MGLMWMLPLLFLIVVVALALRLPWWSARDDRGTRGPDSAREILERRYAGGEITKEQFDEMKRTLAQ